MSPLRVEIAQPVDHLQLALAQSVVACREQDVRCVRYRGLEEVGLFLANLIQSLLNREGEEGGEAKSGTRLGKGCTGEGEWRGHRQAPRGDERGLRRGGGRVEIEVSRGSKTKEMAQRVGRGGRRSERE